MLWDCFWYGITVTHGARKSSITLHRRMSGGFWYFDERIIHRNRNSLHVSVHWSRFLADVPCFKSLVSVATCKCLYLLHPPKQCPVAGSLHPQPMQTSKDHCSSVSYCVLSSRVAMSFPFHQCRTYHESCMGPYKPYLSCILGVLGPLCAQVTVTVFWGAWSKFGRVAWCLTYQFGWLFSHGHTWNGPEECLKLCCHICVELYYSRHMQHKGEARSTCRHTKTVIGDMNNLHL